MSRLQLLTLLSQFLLTRPMRGVTRKHLAHAANVAISTHTPHAGRDNAGSKSTRFLPISTHTPHAGRDGWPAAEERRSSDFYSHAPCGA